MIDLDAPRLVAVHVGAVAPLGPRSVPSGFVKHRVSGSVDVGEVNLAGDAQADLVNHGGPDKAVYGYPSAHYETWSAEYPHLSGIGEMGAFGENLTIAGQTEHSVCVGDIYQIGSVVLQVSQPRKPCFKLALRFSENSVPKRLVESGRCGWYFRVLKTGRFSQGERVMLKARPNPEWPIVRLAAVTYDPASSEEVLRAAHQIQELAPAWRKHIDSALLAQAALKIWDSFRPFRISGNNQQSSTIRSFDLEPMDGGGVVPHLPGQFLTLRIRIAGQKAPVVRTYSLTNVPNSRSYSISVKREGVASSWLHDAPVGEEVECLAPKGRFTPDKASSRPLVLLSAGVGVAPVLSMLRASVVNDGLGGGGTRAVFFIHGARNSLEHAHSADVRALASRHGFVTPHFVYSQPLVDDKVGREYDSEGRIDVGLLRKILPKEDCDFCICGPSGFMRDVIAALSELGVARSRLRMEAFGPSAAPRAGGGELQQSDISTKPVLVVFSRSDRKMTWTPEGGTLLELAEAEGLTLASECRIGNCGVCATSLLAGQVAYADEPSVSVEEEKVLLCCAKPAQTQNAEALIVDA